MKKGSYEMYSQLHSPYVSVKKMHVSLQGAFDLLKNWGPKPNNIFSIRFDLETEHGTKQNEQKQK